MLNRINYPVYNIPVRPASIRFTSQFSFDMDKAETVARWHFVNYAVPERIDLSRDEIHKPTNKEKLLDYELDAPEHLRMEIRDWCKKPKNYKNTLDWLTKKFNVREFSKKSEQQPKIMHIAASTGVFGGILLGSNENPYY